MNRREQAFVFGNKPRDFPGDSLPNSLGFLQIEKNTNATLGILEAKYTRLDRHISLNTLFSRLSIALYADYTCFPSSLLTPAGSDR